jgi:subtilisin-like proprotein convertase family protein
MNSRALFLAMIVAGVSLGAGVPARAADGDVTYSFSGSFDLPIPADPDNTKGWMEDAIIEVPLHLIIRDLDVTVSATHSMAFDLHLYLESPSGTRVLLNMSDPFSGFYEGENYSSTTFDDEADTPIEEGSPPFEGRYVPLGSLAAFDGEDAYGPWELQVYDAYYMNVGTFNSFQLTITTPEPATAVLLLLGLGLAARPPRRR